MLPAHAAPSARFPPAPPSLPRRLRTPSRPGGASSPSEPPPPVRAARPAPPRTLRSAPSVPAAGLRLLEMLPAHAAPSARFPPAPPSRRGRAEARPSPGAPPGPPLAYPICNYGKPLHFPLFLHHPPIHEKRAPRPARFPSLWRLRAGGRHPRRVPLASRRRGRRCYARGVHAERRETFLAPGRNARRAHAGQGSFLAGRRVPSPPRADQAHGNDFHGP